MRGYRLRVTGYGVLLSVLSLMAVNPTRTMPIVYINTDGGQAVESKEVQVPAGIYIDAVIPEYKSLGSAEEPIRGTIKGRGNWTWTGFDKKPYKIKFDAKQKVLGMPGNKHWCLLANADDWLGFLRTPAGHMISEALELRWTPRMVPVELVLNGKYMGLYYLSEHIRIGKNRVNIEEQNDMESDPTLITGGWLVEIDNYASEGNIAFNEGNGQYVMISMHDPDTLSPEQRNYLEQQIYGLNDALYAEDSEDLETMLDIEEAAKYYLVQEIMEDCESYHGSCYLYKDRDSLGTADKWKFGPVWDFGNAYNRHQERWIYDGPTWPQYWIGQLATWPVFQRAVQEQWWIYYHERTDSVRTAIRNWADHIETAAKRDADVWRNTQNYCDNSNFADVRDRFFRRYDWRIQWLYEQWGEGIERSTDTKIVPCNDLQSTKYLRNGQLFIQHNGQSYTVLGQRVR